MHRKVINVDLDARSMLNNFLCQILRQVRTVGNDEKLEVNFFQVLDSYFIILPRAECPCKLVLSEIKI